MIFVTSGTHFFDEHLLEITDFTVRPFLLASMMNEKIIENWNKVVDPNDTVYHLGDITVYVRLEKKVHQDIFEPLQCFNSNLVLMIKGNHDNRALSKCLVKHNYKINGKPKFTFHDVGTLIKYDHRQYYLAHYSLMLGIVPKIINLYGHIHHYAVNARENINIRVDSPEFDYLTTKPKFGQLLLMLQVEAIVEAKRGDYLKR